MKLLSEKKKEFSTFTLYPPAARAKIVPQPVPTDGDCHGLSGTKSNLAGIVLEVSSAPVH